MMCLYEHTQHKALAFAKTEHCKLSHSIPGTPTALISISSVFPVGMFTGSTIHSLSPQLILASKSSFLLSACLFQQQAILLTHKTFQSIDLDSSATLTAIRRCRAARIKPLVEFMGSLRTWVVETLRDGYTRYARQGEFSAFTSCGLRKSLCITVI